MAVALVIFARWDPIRCLWASLLFGGVGALGPALQGQNLVSGSVRYLWYAAPYILTLFIMIVTCSRPARHGRSAGGAVQVAINLDCRADDDFRNHHEDLCRCQPVSVAV